ncbi:ATP-dependent RNA helicase [Malassezia sp. CBS 17886]|nr:ATP-dependent RNA helicase [Malassezia sp. CBS 17886]
MSSGGHDAADARVHARGDGAGPAGSDAGSEDTSSEAEAACACAYCGVAAAECVVQCLGCSKWCVGGGMRARADTRFCNGRGKTSASHIVAHLVRSRHKGVVLHPDSPLGDTIPQCFTCGTKNPFLLGFIPTKSDAMVALLCRHPCASAPPTKDMAWDTSQWSPLILERAFLPWFVREPMGAQAAPARAISSEQIRRLEELWREDEQATLAQVDEADADAAVAPTQMQYHDALQYKRIYTPLVEIEADYDKKLKESQTQDGVDVRWATGTKGQTLAWIQLPQLESGELRLAPGDDVCLRYVWSRERRWAGEAVVAAMPLATIDVCLELKRGDAPTECTGNFSVEFLWKGTTYTRMTKALHAFATDKQRMSSYLYHRLLGRDVPARPVRAALPRHISAPGLPELNQSQAAAVRAALTRPLSLIQGPPGTGKTVTSATIAYHLSCTRPGPVLVCASSNVAVDHLTAKIHTTGLRVVRVAARIREAAESPVDFLMLHEQVAQCAPPELQRLSALKAQHGELSASDQRRFLTLGWQVEREMLQAADVVCTTCVTAGDRRLARMSFHTVLIDEATQAAEPEALIPLLFGCQQLVLVGDHKQLGPVVLSRRAEGAGLSQSLFERLVLLGNLPLRLEVQYRMHPCLTEFPSNMFYDGVLQNGVTARDRERRTIDVPWPDPAQPMMFYQNLGQEEISPTGTSYLNRTEASSVEKIITHFLRAGIAPEQIGVVTPYEGQRSYIATHMQTHGVLRKDTYRTIEVASVDAFQGREKDYIILSCVRSSEHQGIGFLSDPRRMNVALTRARFGLIVIGNPRVLSRDRLWYYLLVHFQLRGVLVEGAFSNLQPSVTQFPRVPPRGARGGAGGPARSGTPPAPGAAPPPRAAGAPAGAPAPAPAWDLAALHSQVLALSESDRLQDARRDRDEYDLDSLHGFQSQASIPDTADDDDAFSRFTRLTEWGKP